MEAKPGHDVHDGEPAADIQPELSYLFPVRVNFVCVMGCDRHDIS
jgi:hypothetical protein